MNSHSEIEVPWMQRAWAWLKAHWYVPFSLLLALLTWAISLLLSKSYDHEPLTTHVQDALDEHKKVEQQHIEEIQRATDAKIRVVEQHHDEELAAFNANEQAEYQLVRRQGPAAVAKWLNDFNKQEGL